MARSHWFSAVSVTLALLVASAIATAATARDVVLLLDNSGSMRKNDPQFLTRRAVIDFLQGFTERSRVALVIFDQKVRLAETLTPITEPTRAGLLEQLTTIDYRGRFTNSPAGMERAIYELKRHGRADAEKIIIFMTDGIVDTGDPRRDRELANWMREGLASEANSAGIRVFGIAFTEAADFQLIQTLTFRTGGTYFRAATAGDIGTAFERINASLQRGEATIAGSGSLPSKTPRPVTPLAGTTLAPETTSTTVIHQSPPTTPSLEALEAEQPASPPDIEQPARREKSPVLKVEKGSAPAPPATSPNEITVKAPSSDAQRSRPQSIPTLAILALVGGALAVLLAVVIRALVRRRDRRPFVRATTPAVAPITSRYPPPFCLLKDLSGATRQESHDITGRLTLVSRAPGEDSPSVRTLVIKDDYISREHAVIEYRDYGYWIIDRGSVNGSFVNDERITSEHLLKHGDRLRFHTYEFEVVLPEMEGQAKTQLAPIPSAEDYTVATREEETVLVGTQQHNGAERESGKHARIRQGEERPSSGEPSTRHPPE
jgi:Mg-chelatase subunit ChlD